MSKPRSNPSSSPSEQPATTATSSAPSSGQSKRARRHAEAQRKRAEAQAEARRRDEEQAEAMVPRAQRANLVPVAMTQDDGTVHFGMLPAKRVTVEKTALGNMRAHRTSTARDLNERQKHRDAQGKHVTITSEHVKAADRLRADYSASGGGIGLGSADLLNRSAARTSPGSGVSEAKIAAVMEQNRARARLEAALTYVGASMDIIVALELHGVSINAWSKARGNWDREHAIGYFAGALDRLAEFYAGGKRVRDVFMVDFTERKPP